MNNFVNNRILQFLLDVTAIRREFPILSQKIDGHPLVYLDNAATAQKPEAVLAAMDRFYRTDNANVHRGMHVLAERSTQVYEDARHVVQKFLGAKFPYEIIFTRGCTEAINLVAKSWGATLHEGDTVLLTMLEHHSNIVPWLQLKEEKGIDVAWVDIDDEGNLHMDHLQELLRTKKVKLISVTAQSNVLGVRPNLSEIIHLAHAAGALVLVDAAQMISHEKIDVTALDCDFLAFSGHKMYGPTGIGVLYGKREHLQKMSPWQGGGMMIQEVKEDRFTSADLPQKFEAGTPPVAEAAGLAAAITWLQQFAMRDIAAHEHDLIRHACNVLSSIESLRILGPKDPDECHGCISFVIDDVHPHDLTEILGRQGICLRAGHHCTQPLHRRLGVHATTRLSVGIYNTIEEIDRTKEAVMQAMKVLHK